MARQGKTSGDSGIPSRVTKLTRRNVKMDIQTRPNGLTPGEESFLASTAQQIMVFLETNRQAIEGRQSRRMAEGLEAFIAGRKSIHGEKAGFHNSPLF